jgi:hypothetical protein
MSKSLLLLSPEQFNRQFFTVMKHFAETADSNKFNFYTIHTEPQNENSWYGRNLNNLIFEAKNEYELWLKFRDYLLLNEKKDIYDYDFIIDIIDEIELEDSDILFDMNKVVINYMYIFKGNYLLWFQERLIVI